MVQDCSYDLKMFKPANYAIGESYENEEEEPSNETYFTHSLTEDAKKVMVQAVLWTKADRRILRREAFGAAVMDSGCSENVCSYKWIEAYIGALSMDLAAKVIRRKSMDVSFKFGAGEIQEAAEQVKIPGEFSRQLCWFQIYAVMNSDIPFLWSKKGMGKAGVMMDILGKKVIPDVTSTGHMCITILPRQGEGDATEVFTALAATNDKEEIRKRLLHLHKQYVHQHLETELKFLRKSTGWESFMTEMVNSIHNKCKICAEYKREIPRPVLFL